MNFSFQYILYCFIGLLVTLIILADFAKMTFPYGFLILLSVIFLFFLFKLYFERIWQKKNNIILILFLLGEFTKGLYHGPDLIDLAVGTGLFIWFLEKMGNKNIKFSKLYIFIGLLIISCLFSCFIGTLSSLVFFFKNMRNFVAVFLITQFLDNKKRAYFLLQALIIIASLFGVIGIFQEVVYCINGIIFPPPAPGKLELLLEQTSLGYALRVSAFTGSPENFAGVLILPICICFFSLFFERTLFRRFFLIVCGSIMLIAFLLTFSHGAWLAILIVLVITMYVKKPFLSIIFSFILLLFIIIKVNGILPEIKQIITYSSDINLRLRMIKNGLECTINRHPFIGIGIGRSRLYYPNIYNWPIHCTIIQVLAEIGIIGFLIYLSMYLFIMIKIMGAILTTPSSENKKIFTAILMGAIGTFLYAQMNPFFLYFFCWMYLAIVDGIVDCYNEKVNLSTDFTQNRKVLLSNHE